MPFESYERLRLREFNPFDVERILKENADQLETENDDLLRFIKENKFSSDMPPDVITEMEESLKKNAAEITRLLSVTYHTDDLSSAFFKGPLYRKDRDVK